MLESMMRKIIILNSNSYFPLDEVELDQDTN